MPLGQEKYDLQQVWAANLKKGDVTAFENIYNEFWDVLFAIAYNRIKSNNDAKDLVQQLFTEIWKNRKIIDIKSSLAAYLHTALKYKIINYKKTNWDSKKIPIYEDNLNIIDSIDPLETLEYKELEQVLHEGIEQLPEKCRLIFKMSRNEGRNAKDIAAKLGISQRTVETHLHHGLKKLKMKLNNMLMILFKAVGFFF